MTYQKGHIGYYKGVSLTDDHRQKISLALKGKLKSAEHIAKLIGNKGRTGQTLSLEHKFKIGQAHRKYDDMERICFICGKIVNRPSGDSAAQFKARKYCSTECKMKAQSQRLKGKICISPMPHEKNPAWKGGAINYLKKQAKIRDDYTCQVCGMKEPQIMEIDHILPKSVFPELALSLDNLITLCPNDHRRKTRADSKRYRQKKDKRWTNIPSNC